jgi:hypothetical protein
MSCQHERYVVLGTREGFDPALGAEVRKDLAAELGPRGYGVCTNRAAEGELAAEIWLSMAEPTLVSIQIDDLVTGKRVWRDVPLTRIPAGGKALAIAIAADELLRASWAELDLPRRDQRVERAAAPSGVSAAGTAQAEAVEAGKAAERRVVNARASPAEESERPRGSRRYALGLWTAFSHGSHAWNAFGLELRAQGHPLGWGWIEGGAGGFGTLETVDDVGSVKARGASASLALGGCAAERRGVALCGGARGGFYWVQFRGQPAGAGSERSEGRAALVASAVGQLGVKLSRRFRALFELALGGAPLGASADYGARTLMGLEGFVFSTALGLGFQP